MFYLDNWRKNWRFVAYRRHDKSALSRQVLLRSGGGSSGIQENASQNTLAGHFFEVFLFRSSADLPNSETSSDVIKNARFFLASFFLGHPRIFKSTKKFTSETQFLIFRIRYKMVEFNPSR